MYAKNKMNNPININNFLCIGADCSLQDSKGKTPAHLAAQRNHPRILEYLLTNGMDIEIPDAKQKRPIHYAAVHGGKVSHKSLELAVY